MTHNVYANSIHTDITFNLRKGMLQVFSCFTPHVFNIEFKEETHPYVVNHFNFIYCKQQILGRN